MKIVVLLSGGLDSTTLLYQHLSEEHEVRAISFNYGQRHGKELKAAKKICKRLAVPLTVVNLKSLREVLPGSSQTDSTVAVPEGRYDEESMKATVVPNRNMILLSIAIGHAIAHKCDAVSFAAHAGDHTIYPDCRPEFVNILAAAAQVCDWHPIKILTPFITLTKSEIVEVGWKLKVKFRQTWSCYQGGKLHCGKCGTCIERREAFYKAGIKDYTKYDPSAPTVAALVVNDWHLPAA